MTELTSQESAQLENAGQAINPWEGPAPVPAFRGFWHDDTYGYAAPLARVLEVPGHAVAAGEGMLAGLGRDYYGLIDHVLGNVPGVRKAYTEPGIEYFDQMRQDATERAQALTPGPRQTGAAIQAGHSLLTALTLAGFGGVAGGPAAAATLVGGGLGYERVAQLEAGGMPSGPAHLLGLETAATNAAGVLVPGLSGIGSNLALRLLTGASANVGFGMANRYLDHVTLQAAGYPEMAQQQKVWDGTSMLFDAILGGGFGALGHLHQQHTARELAERLTALRQVPGMEDAVMAAQLGLRAQSLAPGIPADPAAASAHQAALEKATTDLLAGEPVDVSGTGVDQANFVPFYHGSKHEFVAFDVSKQGTGEGSQARGAGVYVGEQRQTGEYYRNTTVADERAAIEYDGKTYFNGEDSSFGGPQTNGVGWEALHAIKQQGGDRAKAVEAFTQLADREAGITPSRGLEGYYRAVADFAATVDPAKVKPMGGYLYSGRIKREHYDQMLDWDAPLKDQPPAVQKFMQGLGQEKLGMLVNHGVPLKDYSVLDRKIGGDLYEGLAGQNVRSAGEGSDHAAASSARLKEAGIPGLKYLDAGSRVAGKGTRNMVLFDPAIAEITGREGARPFVAPSAAAPTIDTSNLDPRETLLVKSFQDAGLLDAQRNVDELERALATRLGQPTAAGARAAQASAQTEDTSKADSGAAPAPRKPPPGFKIHPDDIPRADPGSLTDAQRAIETRFAEQLARDPDLARRQYGELEDSDGGRILNTDTARELSEDYLADRSQSAAVHEPGSWLIKRMYAEMLKEAPKPGFDPLVLFMAGGTGAGKTSLVQRTAGQLFKRAQIIYDTNFDKLKGAIEKTNDALDAGKRVSKFYIYRDPAEALANGALTRAMKQEAKWGSGRTVPVEVHSDTHVGANHVNEPYAKHFAGHEDVDNNYIDNSRGAGNFAEIALEQIPRLEYNVTREQVAKTLEEEYAARRISDKVYRGFGGTGPLREPGRTGATVAKGPADAGSAGQPQEERRQRPADQLTHSVFTASGRQVEVRPKLVEASTLTTSDKAGYPKELQPRQRGERTALASQVQDMARNLRPEMLGQSAEADRGAPIVGADNVVESGNGRVMALRQVFDSLPDQAAAYRQFLTDSGYDVTGMKEPVLVRERLTAMSPAERTAFTGEANVGSTATYSPVEQAQADAKLLDSGSLAKMAGADLTTYTNAAFLRDFVSGLAPSERSSVMNPDGTISQAGVRRVQAAILAKAYGGTGQSGATLGRLLESTDQNLKSTLNALIDAAPAYARLKQMIEDGVIGKEFDIAPAIVQAVEDVARLQATGQSLKEHFAQEDIFSSRALATQAFYDKAGEKLAGRDKAAAALIRYADQAMAQRLNQGNLFGDPPASPQELLANAKKPETRDMFGLRTKSGELAEGAMVVSAARSALEEKPNLELPDENGKVNRASAQLLAASEQDRTTSERAPPAIEAATDCFLRRGP